MNRLKTHIVLLSATSLVFLGLNACQQGARKTPRLGKDPVKKVVAAMSLEDKANLVVGTGSNFELPDSIMALIPENVRQMINHRTPQGDSAYKAMINRIKGLVPGAAGRTAEFPKYGISTMVLTDGPAGLRILPWRKNEKGTFYCTAFPVATLLASSWDTALVQKVGQAMGNEVLEYGSDVLLAPAMNIHRNPLCGRSFEYYSEDPLIAGETAAAMVKGIQSEGVGTSIKHFVANNQETNRMSVNTIVSQRTLREIYLRGFHIAVKEAHPWTVMSSYNMVNGTYSSENYDLLTKVLRDDWGFKGIVMSDWGAGSDPVAQMKAGNDLIMPGNRHQAKTIIEAVDSGKLDVKVLDRNVERILNIVEKTPRFKGYQYSNHPDLKAHAEVARQAAAEGMILLKNTNHVLPVTNGVKDMAVFGNASYETIIGGTGSGHVHETYSVSIVDGLQNAGIEMDRSLKDTYLSYISKTRAAMPKSKNWLAVLMGAKTPVPEMPVNERLIKRIAEKADMAVITIGRNAGEGADRHVVGDFTLTDTEKSMIANVTKAFHAKGKKIVVVLNIDGVIETVSWRDLPDAILLAWQPGQEAGNAIADVLTGRVDPSGKLATTFPVAYQDEPSAKNFPGKTLENAENKNNRKVNASFRHRMPAEVVYQEGIYVGYRYFNTLNVPVAYAFGYGLSYTDFKYGNMKLSAEKYNRPLTVSVDVKNTGKVAGREVVEVYLHAPAGKLKKPEEELKAFAKTKLLQPGAVQTLQFTLVPEDLASFDETRSAWVADAGKYEVRIGASSRDIRQKASFTLDKEIVVRKVSQALAPQVEIDKLYQ